MKTFITTLCVTFISISASAQSGTDAVEVREFLNAGKSTIIFPAPENELRNDYDDLFEMIEKDYSYVTSVEINSETNAVYLRCSKDIGLVEVSQMMKEFRISKYHYSPEVETAGL